MKKHLRGKRYLKSRASVKAGREKRMEKLARKYIIASDGLSASLQSASKRMGKILADSLKKHILTERATEERDLLYGTGEGEPVGFLKA